LRRNLKTLTLSLITKLAKQSALYGLSSIATRVLAFAFLTPFLTYSFGKADMGIQTELYSWAAFLLIPFTYRMETAMFRFGSRQEELMPAFRTAAISVILSTFALTIILLLLTPKLAYFIEYQDKQQYIVWIILIVAMDALMAIPFALLRLQEKALNFAAIKIINMLTYLGLVFFFVKAGPDLYVNKLLFAHYWYNPFIGIGWVFIANLIANLLTLVLLVPSYKRLFQNKEKNKFFDIELWKKMLRYAGPLIIVGLAAVVNEVLDRTLLKLLLTGDLDSRLAQVGIYGACYKIAIFMNLLTQAFNYAAEPFFFKHAAKEGSRQLYADVALLFSIVGSLVFLAVMLLMDIFQYFVAAPYREGLHIVPILLLANLFLGLYYSVASWYKLADKTVMGIYISGAGAIITIFGNLLLIPLLGYAGAAWATLLCYGSMLLLAWYLGQKYYPVPYNYQKTFIYITTAIVLYLIYSLIKTSLEIEFWLGITLGFVFLACYLTGLIYFEVKYLKKILKRNA
jgi:O-antigen/teichoic acid export membrane protein